MSYLFIFLVAILAILPIILRLIGKDTISKKLSAILNNLKPYIFIIDVILFILYLVKSFGHTGYIFTAVMLFSLPLFLLTDKKNFKLFFLSFVSGLMFSLVFSYSSNGMLYVLSMGHFIASFGGIVFIYDFIKELSGNSSNLKVQNTLIGLAYAVLFVVLIETMVLRITNVYRDDKLSNLTERIENGPAKGLYTSKEHSEMYKDVYSTIETYCMKNSEKGYETLLISKLLPFGYVLSDLRAAAPTVWRNPMDSERLKTYYDLHNERYPDIILLLDDKYGSYETCGDVEADPCPNENAKDGYIYDYIESQGFEKITVPCGLIYSRK